MVPRKFRLDQPKGRVGFNIIMSAILRDANGSRRAGWLAVEAFFFGFDIMRFYSFDMKFLFAQLMTLENKLVTLIRKYMLRDQHVLNNIDHEYLSIILL